MSEYGERFSAAVAAELRAQRARTRITFDALAERAGLAKTTALNYLNGRRDIPLHAFANLCRALGVSPRTIFESAELEIERGSNSRAVSQSARLDDGVAARAPTVRVGKLTPINVHAKTTQPQRPPAL